MHSPPGPDAHPHPTRKKPGGCVWEGGGIPEADYIIIVLVHNKYPVMPCYAYCCPCGIIRGSRTNG